MALAYIGFGSNLGHPRRQIGRAVRALRRLPRSRLVCLSPNYCTAPIGGDASQPDYINAVAIVATALAPRALLARLLAIERKQRRKRIAGDRNAPRTLDCDLLLFGARRLRTHALTLPHPRMHERAFVLRPLSDIAPTVPIPGHGPAQRLLKKVAGQRVRRTRSHRASF
ncbi:MAG TPA: 2-amino-4-hydroxy-6-hydroxymethyldihydropteridine diphosphokinase [Casimicrobiaceae bacterium]|nr:2-amino-4-hydroxy-6-hydroxymethyldihydropteridine diphosphokinase [Casimicrobiaceae bacterium]